MFRAAFISAALLSTTILTDGTIHFRIIIINPPL
jgi:hypothetical protein